MEDVNALGSLIRFIADDQESQWLDMAVQMPSINSGWREFQQRFALADSPIMKKTVTFALPAGQATVGFAPDPVVPGVVYLPDDFVMPYILEERPAGQATQGFTPMEEKRWPPGVQAKQLLVYWTWEAGVLGFLGATQDIEVRMEYVRQFDALIAPNQTIPIPFAIDALAYCVLFQVALARGASGDLRDRCDQMANRKIDQLLAIHIKRDQIRHEPRPPANRWKF